MIPIEQINTVKIRPVIHQAELLDPDRILGYDMFPELYSNIFLLAKKKSGKTNLIYNILKKSIKKDTRVIFFVSTIHKDATYKKILEMLDTKKIDYTCFDSFKDDDGDILKQIVNDLKLADETIIEDDGETKAGMKESKFVPILKNGFNFGDVKEIKPREKKVRKEKGKLAPKIIIVMDDMGRALRNPNISQIVKTNRHSKLRVILSSQWIHDLENQSIKNLDYVLCFRSLAEDKLKKLYSDLDLSIDFDLFYQMYLQATEKPYSFFYIAARDGEYRQNFNKKFILDE